MNAAAIRRSWPVMISFLDLFKVGIGPSSSHTVGPMTAARAFAMELAAGGLLPAVARVRVELLGSLAWTGQGHGTGPAVILGLAGELAEAVEPAAAVAIHDLAAQGQLYLAGERRIGFLAGRDVVFDTLSPTPRHPNTLVFSAFDAEGVLLATERVCSIGGGFVVSEPEVGAVAPDGPSVPFPFRSGAELLLAARRAGLTIPDLVLANEHARHSAATVERHFSVVLRTMMECIDRGIAAQGELPGGLRVRRRAGAIQANLTASLRLNRHLPHEMMDHVSLFAIAVNEENAAGGRVVTAPTNGAAGVIPAVLRYLRDMVVLPNEAEALRDFLLAATAIGVLFKLNASISGAEVGCQGEVGVACAMAAAGMAAALGGSNEQIENAAEIGMEHHLGMTCDPVGGLVQIPCIERNAFGAIKAINAASLALHGDGTHRVSLDHVIATMRQTGADMSTKYKETSQGGLAVNFPEC